MQLTPVIHPKPVLWESDGSQRLPVRHVTCQTTAATRGFPFPGTSWVGAVSRQPIGRSVAPNECASSGVGFRAGADLWGAALTARSNGVCKRIDSDLDAGWGLASRGDRAGVAAGASCALGALPRSPQ
jgi:hypothetical protein